VCASDDFCADAVNCNNDGECDPFNEGCVCADCANHPSCSGGPGFTCTLDPNCPASDLAACVCAGCSSDCAASDCTCAGCAADPYCSDPASCTDDGACDPYLEGCICADCAQHPACGGSLPLNECDDIGVCSASGPIDPTSNCLDCAVFGDATVAANGGDCLAVYDACFGVSGDCSNGEPDCCAFYGCFTACDTNSSGSIEAGSELDCYCTNADDGSGNLVCSAVQLAGTCQGDHQVGLATAFAYEDCVVGIQPPGACVMSCL